MINSSLPAATLEKMAFLRENTISTTEQLLECEYYLQNHGMMTALSVQKAVNPIVESMNATSISLDYRLWITKGLDPWVTKRNDILDEIQQYLGIGMYSVQDDNQILERARLKGIAIESSSLRWLANHQHDDWLVELFLRKKNADLFLKRFKDELPVPNEKGISLLSGKWNGYSSFSGRIVSNHMPMAALPRAMRDYYVAPDIDGEKAVYVSFDESQIELRLLAGYSSCSRLLTQLIEGEDIHRFFASKLFGVPEEAVDERMRRLSKKLVYGTLYGAGPNRLHEISRKSGLDVVTPPNELLKKLYPEMLVALSCFRRAKVVWYGLRPTKIPTKIGDIWMSSARKQNMSLQSAAALLLKQCLVRLPSNIRVVNIIHDELIVWCKCTNVPLVTRQVRTAYSQAATDLRYRLPQTNLVKVQILGGKVNEQ
ncbi:DNA polymerase [Levilactobacillus brevis]|uniref:DNA polymerase n=1 Tax=Levilactobacillus brevis TaxID=1580 RepID=UPI00111A69E8|nr:DNA polymerase [Levilactobacillus brevis]QCZ44478.1 DNA polymerase I [Levilactobacillus brevis]